MFFQFSKYVFLVLLIWIILGLVGVMVDALTGGVHGWTERVMDSGEMVLPRVSLFIRSVNRKSWYSVPLLVLAFMVSPFMFAFYLCVYLLDGYTGSEVWYQDGVRFFGRTLDKEQASTGSWFSGWFWPISPFPVTLPNKDGLYYNGVRVPRGAIIKLALKKSERKVFLADEGYDLVNIGGIEVFLKNRKWKADSPGAKLVDSWPTPKTGAKPGDEE